MTTTLRSHEVSAELSSSLSELYAQYKSNYGNSRILDEACRVTEDFKANPDLNFSADDVLARYIKASDYSASMHIAMQADRCSYTVTKYNAVLEIITALEAANYQ